MSETEQFVTGPKILRRGRGKSLKSLTLIGTAYNFLKVANPATVRGVCYKLFTLGIIPSMHKNETSRVSRLLTDAREQGMIPWEWIVDEHRELERSSSWRDAADYVDTIRRAYRRDFWLEQPGRVEVWSEKGTIRGVIAPVLEEFGVGFRVMHGFGSSTTLHEVASEGDSELLVLYVGDYDPSGLYMSAEDVPRRLLEYGGDHIQLIRIALTEYDLEDLPFFRASDKRRDPRYNWFLDRYGDRCWELDAMDPNALRDRVRDNIESVIEPTAWNRCVQAQEAEQESLESLLAHWSAA